MPEMHPEELCGRALRAGADFAEAWVDTLDSRKSTIYKGVLQPGERQDETGFGLRVFKGSGQALVSSQSTDAAAIRRLAESAVRYAKKSSRFSENQLSLEGVPVMHAKSKVKGAREIESLPDGEMESILQFLDGSLQDALFPSKFFEFGAVVEKKIFANSAGCRIQSVLPRVTLLYNIVARRDAMCMQKMWQFGHTGGFSLVKKEKYAERTLGEALELRKCLSSFVKMRNKRADVVLSPELAGIIAHESCGHALEADRIMGLEFAQGGKSFADFSMKGEKIGSSAVSVSDDAAIPNSWGFFEFDDEGTKKTKTGLIKDGFLSGFLHNRFTAAAAKQRPTGNARRASADSLPLVRMSNTFFEPGDCTEEELFDDIKLGVYFKSFMEWNIDDLRKNQKYVGCVCYLIKNRAVSSVPVHLPALELETSTILNSIDAGADNFVLHAASCGKGEPMQGVAAGMGGPSLRMRGVKLS